MNTRKFENIVLIGSNVHVSHFKDACFTTTTALLLELVVKNVYSFMRLTCGPARPSNPLNPGSPAKPGRPW